MDFRVRDLILPYLEASKLAGYCFRDAVRRNKTRIREKNLYYTQHSKQEHFHLLWSLLGLGKGNTVSLRWMPAYAVGCIKGEKH